MLDHPPPFAPSRPDPRRFASLKLSLLLILGALSLPHHPAVADEPPDRAGQAGTEGDPAPAAPPPAAPPGMTLQTIDWREAFKHPRLDPSALPEAERAKLDGISLPVLIPEIPTMLSRALILHGGTWYTASLQDEGHSVYIRGTRASRTMAPLKIDEERWGPETRPLLTRTHGVITVSFTWFGAAYSLEVECKAAMADPRCAEDDYAMGLVKDLKLVGGRE